MKKIKLWMLPSSGSERLIKANRFVRTVHFNATVNRMIHQSNESSLERVLSRNVRFYSKIYFS